MFVETQTLAVGNLPLSKNSYYGTTAGRKRNSGPAVALSGEGLLRLNFLVTFCFKTKSDTRRIGKK
jgi:hypothetical protein